MLNTRTAVANPHNISPTIKTEGESCCAPKAKVESAAPRFDITAYISRYQPVFMIAGASILGGFAISNNVYGLEFMHGAMGLFLFQLALLKLVDIGGFAEAFARYDIAAKAWRPYGYVYPFAELMLALGYLSGAWPTATYAATLVIMGLGSIGVVRTLASGEKVKCACTGSKIDVPLGTISVIENVGMAAMAAVMLAI